MKTKKCHNFFSVAPNRKRFSDSDSWTFNYYRSNKVKQIKIHTDLWPPKSQNASLCIGSDA
jgi:hypothetical protein